MGSYAALVQEADRHTRLKPSLAAINQNTTTQPKYACLVFFFFLSVCWDYCDIITFQEKLHLFLCS